MRTFFFTATILLFAQIGIAQDYKMNGNELVFDQAITFNGGSAELTNNDIKILTAVKDFLNEKKYVSTLRIEGHVASNKNNAQNLSEQRANAIAKWLIQQGIDCKRLIIVGFGSTKPIVANEPKTIQKNTRICFVIAALRDKLIGGMSADGGGQIAGDPCAK